MSTSPRDGTSEPPDDILATSNPRARLDAAQQVRDNLSGRSPEARQSLQDDVVAEVLPPMPALRNTIHERMASSASDSASSAAGSAVGSRTHIPSLTSRAFFAPMSSQRLQAHRSQRPISEANYRPRPSEDFDENRSATNRNSTGSVITTMGPRGQTVQYDLDTMPPMSRGTDYSDWTNIAPTIGSGEFERTMMPGGKRQESLEPLQQRRDLPTPLQSNGQHGERFQPTIEARENSPSFMSNFKRSSRQSANGTTIVNVHTNGHSRLPSEPPFTNPVEEKRLTPKHNRGRNHEYFEGRTIFFFGGRFQNARVRPVVIITGLLILVPSILFFVFSAPWLWHHSSPAIPILYAYVFYICMTSFIHASVSNPGVLPRNLHTQQMPDPTEDPLAVQANNRWMLMRSATSKHGLFEIPTKYCSTCNIWRPPRCHHCRVCDNCVETQDHHCVWLNNCVGRRNYRYFFAFISSAALLGIFLFAASIGHVGAWAKHNGTSFAQSINHNRAPFAMFIYGVLAFMYPLALLGYHVFLIVRGQTTHEFLNSNRFRDLDRHRPFNQRSLWKNLVVVLLRPRPPTYLKFKGKYEDGDQRLGQRKGSHAKAGTSLQQNASAVEMNQLGYSSIPSFQGPHSRSRAPINITPR